MKANKLKKLGIPPGPIVTIAMRAVTDAEKSGDYPHGIKHIVKRLAERPDAFVTNPHFGELARALIDGKQPPMRTGGSALSVIWGEGFEKEALEQLENACSLPVAVRAALMPDAHVGYGLPIGGVLATRDAIIPSAVGVDIACRMKMTVFDIPVAVFENGESRFKRALTRETAFGVGAEFKKRKRHPVMDGNWEVSDVTRRCKDKAWSQLGTSGSGNHFVEFGTLTVERDGFTLPPGAYLALLSHSGSRGTGNEVARHFSAVARKLHPELSGDIRHLAWLDIETAEGEEYWAAMQLMGCYAAANHELIHAAIARHLGAQVILDIENHHNFAWKETHFGETMVVHRKGATPAGEGGIGIIPGSMGTPGYIVKGRGNPASLNSASHGAGRRMSRNAAKKTFSWKEARSFLAERKVTLLSSGLDEVPMAYKDIETVMRQQSDLVEPMARFDPRMVRMAPPGERTED